MRVGTESAGSYGKTAVAATRPFLSRRAGSTLFPASPFPAAAPMPFSSYTSFDRDQWAALRFNTPLTLTEADLAELKGLNEALSLREVVEVYLPLSRLLNLHLNGSRDLARVMDVFLGRALGERPYLIGIAGSVAVGKSTTARVMRALLARWPDHPRVALVTTDGFLFPNAELERQGLMQRKGFPESYDTRRLVQFVADLKAGNRVVRAPVYSHLVYDILPGEEQVIEAADIVIIEGLNVLQGGDGRDGDRPFVSDFFDFSIYVDAEEASIQEWFLGRFKRLRETAFRDPKSFFRRYAEMPEAEALAFAARVWREINGRNLKENIAPTKERAHLVLEKAASHEVTGVRLRKV
jgi:type I pantothenate kinase